MHFIQANPDSAGSGHICTSKYKAPEWIYSLLSQRYPDKIGHISTYPDFMECAQSELHGIRVVLAGRFGVRIGRSWLYAELKQSSPLISDSISMLIKRGRIYEMILCCNWGGYQPECKHVYIRKNKWNVSKHFLFLLYEVYVSDRWWQLSVSNKPPIEFNLSRLSCGRYVTNIRGIDRCSTI